MTKLVGLFTKMWTSKHWKRHGTSHNKKTTEKMLQITIKESDKKKKKKIITYYAEVGL